MNDSTRIISVTSTGPGEGKTMVSGNLAISLAETGKRVILIDADLRRPKVHELLDVPQEPGLSNLLVGGADASDVVPKTSVPGLWVMPAGRAVPNPAELLGSTKSRELLEGLR